MRQTVSWRRRVVRRERKAPETDMEEADELQLKAGRFSSAAESAPQVMASKDSKIREEGELSSSENDGDGDNEEKRAVYTYASTAKVMEPTSLPLENRSSSRIEDGEAVHMNNTQSSLDIQSQMSTLPDIIESFDKRQVLPSTKAVCWEPSFSANSNLVIWFSDNDSGSDTEECIKKKVSKPQNNFVKIRRPPTSLQAKSSKSSQTSTNANKVIPKKLPLSCSFVSSTGKNRENYSTAAGQSLFEQGSRRKSFNILNRSLLNRENDFDQGTSMSDSKLKDLRERIAFRESELKLKSVLVNKELASISTSDQNVLNQKDAICCKSSAIAGQFTQVEPKEPDKKRLKVSGSYSTQYFLSGPQELPTATGRKLSSPMLGEENSHFHDLANSKHIKKDNLMGRPQTSLAKRKKHDSMQLGNSPENIPRLQDGSLISSNIDHSEDARLKNLNIMKSNHQSNIDGSFTSTLNPTTREELVRTEFTEAIYNHETPDQLKSAYQVSQKARTPCINKNFWEIVGRTNVSGNHNNDVKSIVEIEESFDKDLEQAQEHRHRCEIKERNAFRGHCKAQRDLAEANARCVDLYCKRDLYSAHVRSIMIENSSSTFSSKKHNGISDNLDKVNENNQLYTADLPIQPEINGFVLPQNDSNIQLANSDIHTSNQEEVEHVMESESCSKAMRSEKLSHDGKNTAGGFYCSSDHINMSDEDFSYPFSNRRSIELSTRCHIKERDAEGQSDTPNEEEDNYFGENFKDSLLLEARLRSKLFQKLAKKNVMKNSGSCHNLEPARERWSQADERTENFLLNDNKPCVDEGFAGNIRCDKNQISNVSAPFSDTKENQSHDLREGSLSKIGNALSPCLKSVFYHVKNITQASLEDLLPGNGRFLFNEVCNQEVTFTKLNELYWSNLPRSSVHETVGYLCGKEIGSYTCHVVIDSFLPICMYELRGKCNNDECMWQHIKDHSKENMHQNKKLRSNFTDHGFPRNKKTDVAGNVQQYQDSSTPITYIVCLDILKSNLSSYGSSLIWRNAGSWKKFLSISLTPSNFLQKDSEVDGTFFHDGRIEVHGHFRKSSFFQSRNSQIQAKQEHADSEQALEVAFLILDQEASELDGLKKASPVLSRAAEADPTSAVIWVVYLLIFCSNTNPVGKDDMFSFAVKQNDRSYELWLLYINSRMQLDVRLSAYEDAIRALCHHATFDGNGVHDSACILDLFLQVINCMCISGNVEKAKKQIFSIIPITETSDEDHFAVFTDILTCLTVFDKCIFWVCCLYFVNYGKLPDVIVQQFECEKELNELEWPAVHLADDERLRLIKLVQTAVGNFDSYTSAESLKSKDNLRSAQIFALNHIRCVLSFDCSECKRSLLDKYIKLYPFCLELNLLSACSNKHCQGAVNFEGFEECLKKWPKEVPGVQCIWNQYAEYALQNGRFEYAKELMVLWFDSVWVVTNLENGTLDSPGGNSCDLLRAIRHSNSHQIDVVFGYINLSLFMLLQNNLSEARLAINYALEAATPETYKHCLKEYAMFLLADESLLQEFASIGGMKSIFEGYITSFLAFSALKPLSRNFITSIKKPIVQQLVNNLLKSFSPSSSVMNSVLEVWFGPHLLPRDFKEPKILVDFVETILEILPSNYQLAISVCKLICTSNGSSKPYPPSFLFWASSNLVSAIFHSIPIPPEFVWVEAASILNGVMGMEAITEKFYKRGLLAHPFSAKLWKSYYNLCKTRGDASCVVQAAKERGIKLV